MTLQWVVLAHETPCPIDAEGMNWDVHVEPPFVVLISVQRPAAQQTLAVGQETLLISVADGLGGVWAVHVVPPLDVAKIAALQQGAAV